MESIYLGFLWMLYYFLHSALATDRIKEFLQSNFPNIVKSYRLIYSFFAIVNFLLLGWFHTLVNSEFLFNQNQITMGIGVFFCWSGAGIVFIALKSYPFSFWFSDNGSSALVRQGLNSWVRHPLYLGTFIFLVGFFLLSPNMKNLVFLLITVLYLIIGSLLEEQKLLRQFGKEYADYREDVNMLIPFVF